eukprot:gb/GECG01007802.1/.p1 GENE.gb/GECG01007802.1/~~gb/GECG01007802.1/.p1  ORF type:complete len:133 (+),score=4.45 gb/GECG01007802.1/:1-399(+)
MFDKIITLGVGCGLGYAIAQCNFHIEPLIHALQVTVTDPHVLQCLGVIVLIYIGIILIPAWYLAEPMRINVDAIDNKDPYTQRSYRESSFNNHLRRRGSYDLSYLDQAVHPAFLARHMVSYMKGQSKKKKRS